jgi:glycine oxidase
MKVAIIGGGIAGLAIGWRLAQAGADVTIIERAEPGAAATRAAAGMIAVAGETAGAPQAEIEFARHASDLWPVFASELESASGQRVSYLRNGALLVLKAGEAIQNELGVTLVSRNEALALEPMLTGEYARIALAPREAQVDNRALGPALAQAFTRAGGKLVRDAAAAIIVDRGRAVGVACARDHHKADAVLVAAGAWSAGLQNLPRELRAGVKPIKGEMIAVAPAEPGPRLGRVIRSARAYLVPRGDRIVVGATVVDTGFDASLSGAVARELFDAAVELLPGLASWNCAEHWAGLRPGSPDNLPLLGKTSVEGLYAATGQFRNGILFAPAIADLLCRVILRQASVPVEFDPRRFGSAADTCANP